MEKTLSYTEKVKGWTSFHSFIPEFMVRLKNRFYTIKAGQLWLHNDESNPVLNNFYGVQYDSKVITIFNDAPSDDKIFKTLILEGTHPWAVALRTNYTEGTILKSEFNNRESRWFANTRKSENNNDYTASVQGIGVIQSFTGLTIAFVSIGPLVSVGDVLHQINGSADQVIGTITNINGNVVTLNAIITTPVVGLFCFSKKNSRIEGSEIRGYFMEVELTQNDTHDVELFAINSNAIKSYV
jgi:hypothetical protein